MEARVITIVKHKCTGNIASNQNEVRQYLLALDAGRWNHHWFDAIEILSELVNCEGISIDAYFERANAYCEVGMFSRAVPDLERVIRFNPTLAKAHSLRGMCHTMLRNHQLAINDFTRAYKLGHVDDGHLDAAFDLLGRSVSLVSIGKTNSADSLVDLAYSLKDFRIAKLAFRRQDFDTALSLAESMFIKHPHGAAPMFLMGRCNMAMGKPLIAARCFSNVICDSPDFLPARYFRAQVNFETENYAEVLTDCKHIIRSRREVVCLDPDGTSKSAHDRFFTLHDVKYLLAHAYVRLELWGVAVEEFSHMIFTHPHCSAAHASRAIVFTALGAHDRAARDQKIAASIIASDKCCKAQISNVQQQEGPIAIDQIQPPSYAAQAGTTITAA
jgi:tetratricopeptide (TPR) repeat protein